MNADLHTAVVLLQKACVAAALDQLDSEGKGKCQHINQRSALLHILPYPTRQGQLRQNCKLTTCPALIQGCKCGLASL